MSAAQKLNKTLEFREADFRREVNAFTKFPELTRKEFFDYWSEPDRAPNPKMRFEKEKTWDLSRRLSRWAGNNFGKAPVIRLVPKEEKKPETDIEILDALLTSYRKSPTAIEFEKLADFYEPIKALKLWASDITKGEMNSISLLYHGQERKIKAWIVQRTLNWYANNGWLFSRTLNVRNAH